MQEVWLCIRENRAQGTFILADPFVPSRSPLGFPTPAGIHGQTQRDSTPR